MIMILEGPGPIGPDIRHVQDSMLLFVIDAVNQEGVAHRGHITVFDQSRLKPRYLS